MRRATDRLQRRFASTSPLSACCSCWTTSSSCSTLRARSPICSTALPALESLSQYEAVALFLERARAVAPSFGVTDENAPAVAELCVRLDGLPLAIELAAARVKLLPPQALLARLEQRLELLRGGARDRPERQQTLRAALDWSFDLLDAEQQEVFAGLSVFAGGFRLEAAEAICEADLETVDVLLEN